MKEADSSPAQAEALRSPKRNGTFMAIFNDSSFACSSLPEDCPAPPNSYKEHVTSPEANSPQLPVHSSPTPSKLSSRSFSSETSFLPSKNTSNPLSSSRNHSSPHRHPGFRHTMYIQRIKGSDERGVLRDIEKLRLDPPRKSFETDTDSDYHSLPDYTFNTDDLTDISSTATSEVRRSTDSLTPSEMEQVKAEYQAELTLEEALNSSEIHVPASEKQTRLELEVAPTFPTTFSNDLSPKASTSSIDSAFPSTPIASPPLPSGPPRIKPIPPKSEDDPKAYLKYLEDTFSRDEIGSLLSKNDEFHSQVLEAFMDSLKFKDLPIDMALRKLVSVLFLPKEGQQIDRIISVFSKRYFEANVGLFVSEDVVYSLSFSLLLLHTDAHNKLVKNKMTKSEYIKQTRQLDDASFIPVEVLEILYDNVTTVEFFRNDDIAQQPATMIPSRSWYQKLHEGRSSSSKSNQHISSQMNAAVKVSSLFGSFKPDKSPYAFRSSQNVFSDSFLKSPFKIRVKGLQPFYQSSPKSRPTSGFSITCIDETADISELRCLKEGLLLRKSDIGGSGRKTHLRAWREFWVVLAGNQLVLFREVSAMRMRQRMKNSETFPAPRPYSITSVANVVAVMDSEYTKHPYAFRFITSDGRQYLFRTASKQDMTEWMTKINFTAAYKSVDILPRGVALQNTEPNRNELPRIKNFDFEEDDEDQFRRRAILSKVAQLETQYQIFKTKIEELVHLCRQLKIMVIFSRTTRDRTLQSIENIRARSRRIYIDLQRIQCYKEILLQDLAFGAYP